MSKPKFNYWISAAFGVGILVVAFMWAHVAYGAPAPASQPALDLNGPWSMLDQIWIAAHAHAWGIVGVMTVALAVLGLRWVSGLVALKLTGPTWLVLFFNFWHTDRGGAILALLSGASSAWLTAIMAGRAVSLQLILGGLGTGVAAAGGVNIIKRILFPPDQVAVKVAVGTDPDTARKPAVVP
jgi:hypothetical protein